jgi:undecaprenyl-diphosphatase
MISVFKNINRFAGQNKQLDLFAIFCARYLPYFLVLFLLIFSIVNKKWEIFVYPVVSALFARLVIDNLIYYFYKEVRPAYLKTVNLLIPIPKNPSFPSSHATVFSAISFTLIFYNLNLGIAFLCLSFLIGISRVFCGVHWFRDILGGFAAGLFSAIIVYYLLNLIL